MKFTISSGKSFFDFTRIKATGRTGWIMICILLFQLNELKSQNCSLCCVPSFPELTVYQTVQTGHGLGFGIEAGNWQKDAGKFSYFLGTNMVWSQNTNSNIKNNSSQNQMLLSLYVKGQYKITNHLFAVAAPAVINLSYFDFQTGLRYVIPVTKEVGVGIEPAYSFNQKVVVVNLNLHFALR